MTENYVYLLDPYNRCPGFSKGWNAYRGFRVFATLDAAKAAMQAHIAEPIEWQGTDQTVFCGAFYNEENWPDIQIWRVEVEGEMLTHGLADQ